MKTTPRHYSLDFKLNVLRDYYENGLSKYATCRKYGIGQLSTLRAWIKAFPLEGVSLESESEQIAMTKKELTPTEELEKRIKDLEKALECEKMRSRGFEIMIDVAEKELQIPIRKKSGAKQ